MESVSLDHRIEDIPALDAALGVEADLSCVIPEIFAVFPHHQASAAFAIGSGE
jgi:hypothetical protein